jgi:hypothetical protein
MPVVGKKPNGKCQIISFIMKGMKVLLCNVCWMKEYKGVTKDDVPRHGGKFVSEHGYGYEVINFSPNGGKVYGFVQRRTGSININRLDPTAEDRTDGTLVVWRARSSHGSVVVGWYENATVFRHKQPPPQGRQFSYKGEPFTPEWIITANSGDAFLVPPHQRFFRVPVSHKGFGSQTFVSFLDSDLREVTDFKERLLQYIKEAKAGHYAPPTRGRTPQVDQARKLRIERAAIAEALRYYGDRGYNVDDVQNEKLGYDLKATFGDTLLIEVKGTAAHVDDGVTVNLSPNEYRTSKSASRQYRIFIVSAALTTPTVNEFLWDSEECVWTDENTGKRLSVVEVVSADMTITG